MQPAGTSPAGRNGTQRLSWSRREPPLPAAAVAATGTALGPLRDATLARPPEHELRAIGGDDWLVVLGNDLPWADGAVYLGWDSGILVPTTATPSLPVALLRGALPSAGLVVLLPDQVLLSDAPVWAVDPTLLAGG